MNAGAIYNIDLTTNSKDIISISPDYFSNFYIANLDDNGDEIGYVQKEDNSLDANFFMMKVINDKTFDCLNIINRLKEKKDIIKVCLYFNNGNKQEFNIAKRRVASNGTMENIYEDTFEDNDDVCILITDKKIKFKKELFI